MKGDRNQGFSDDVRLEKNHDAATRGCFVGSIQAGERDRHYMCRKDSKLMLLILSEDQGVAVEKATYPVAGSIP